MRLTILIGITALSLGATATASSNYDRAGDTPSVLAYDIPGTEYRGQNPTQPEKTDPPHWDDTADISDELELELREEQHDNDSEVYFEKDLNNDVHSPLLEDSSQEPEELPPIDERKL